MIDGLKQPRDRSLLQCQTADYSPSDSAPRRGRRATRRSSGGASPPEPSSASCRRRAGAWRRRRRRRKWRKKTDRTRRRRAGSAVPRARGSPARRADDVVGLERRVGADGRDVDARVRERERVERALDVLGRRAPVEAGRALGAALELVVGAVEVGAVERGVHGLLLRRGALDEARDVEACDVARVLRAEAARRAEERLRRREHVGGGVGGVEEDVEKKTDRTRRRRAGSADFKTS